MKCKFSFRSAHAISAPAEEIPDPDPDDPFYLLRLGLGGGILEGTYFYNMGQWSYCPSCAFHVSISEVTVYGSFTSNVSSYAPSNTSYSDLWRYEPSPGAWQYWEYPAITGSGGGTWNPDPNFVPSQDPSSFENVDQANLGGGLFVSEIKNVLQDIWCIYIGQISGEISQEAHAFDFFDYRNIGTNFVYTAERPVYIYESSSYRFTFQDNPDDEFESVQKYFPGNPSGQKNSDANGIGTTDIFGNSLPYPYGIRIYGTTGNIATLYFSSKSTWEGWWNYMKVPQSNGDCNY